MQDAADLVWRQKMAAALAEEPGPAFAEAVDLVTQHPAAIGDRADRGVQAGTVPAAGEDTDAHADYLRCTVILTAYVVGWAGRLAWRARNCECVTPAAPPTASGARCCVRSARCGGGPHPGPGGTGARRRRAAARVIGGACVPNGPRRGIASAATPWRAGRAPCCATAR